MTKKNYYEILGISRDISEEQIWEKFVELKRKFYQENPINNEEEKKERFRKFNNILGTLTDSEERKRYDKHLNQFGQDESFQPSFDIEKKEDFDRITNKIFKKYEARIEKLEFEKWKKFHEKREELRQITDENKEWKCEFCQQPYEKLIIYSKENPTFKFCLSCFSYVQGKMVGKGYKEPTLKLIKEIKEIEKEWELVSPFSLISYFEIAKNIKEEKKITG